MLTDSTVFQRNEGVISSEIDGEVVMLDIDKGTYYNLDEVGSHIWKILKSPQKIEGIAYKLIDLYDITLIECKNDIYPFLQDLVKKKLIEINN